MSSTINVYGKDLSCNEYYEYLRKKDGQIKDLDESVLECIDEKQLQAISKRVDWIQFSLRFQNKYPEKLELIKPYLKWLNISFRRDLSEEFILQFHEYLNLENLNIRVITNKIIDTFSDKMDWNKVSGYKGISDEIIEKYQTKLHWGNLTTHRKLSEEEFDRYKIHFKEISVRYLDKVSRNFLKKYEKQLDWKEVSCCRQAPCDMLDEHVKDFYPEDESWKYIRQQINLEEWFIMKYYDELSNSFSDYTSQNSSKRLIKKVLQNNGFSRKKNRSEAFNKFLDDKEKSNKDINDESI